MDEIYLLKVIVGRMYVEIDIIVSIYHEKYGIVN